jgi:hypothetical protein
MCLFSVSPDRARYEGSVRLANLTALRDNMAATGHSRTLQNILEKQVRASSVYVIYVIVVCNKTARMSESDEQFKCTLLDGSSDLRIS